MAVGLAQLAPHAAATALVGRAAGHTHARLAVGGVGTPGRGHHHHVDIKYLGRCRCGPHRVARLATRHLCAAAGCSVAPLGVASPVCVCVGPRLFGLGAVHFCGQPTGPMDRSRTAQRGKWLVRHRVLAHGLGRCFHHGHDVRHLCGVQAAVAGHLVGPDVFKKLINLNGYLRTWQARMNNFSEGIFNDHFFVATCR